MLAEANLGTPYSPPPLRGRAVIGYAYQNVDADGVQGFGAGAYSGVAGWGGNSSGTGVIGFGGEAGGPGVRGIGNGGPNSSPSEPVGVFGQGGNSGTGVLGFGGAYYGAGVRGIGFGATNLVFQGAIGVYGAGGDGAPGMVGIGGGYSGSPHSVGAPGVVGVGAGGIYTPPLRHASDGRGLPLPVGVYGKGGPDSDGVYGVAGDVGSAYSFATAGIHGVGNEDAHAGLFEGSVLITGGLSINLGVSMQGSLTCKDFGMDTGDFFANARTVSIEGAVVHIIGPEVRIYGPLDVRGRLTKSGGGFQIYHPLDPENKHLVHSVRRIFRRK